MPLLVSSPLEKVVNRWVRSRLPGEEKPILKCLYKDLKIVCWCYWVLHVALHCMLKCNLYPRMSHPHFSLPVPRATLLCAYSALKNPKPIFQTPVPCDQRTASLKAADRVKCHVQAVICCTFPDDSCWYDLTPLSAWLWVTTGIQEYLPIPVGSVQ